MTETVSGPAGAAQGGKTPGGKGGLTICQAPAPDDWVITDYDADRERIVTFLEQKAQKCVRIPYLANRAVLFRSRLFHHSDAPEFATDYEGHRINMTLLFGHFGPGRDSR